MFNAIHTAFHDEQAVSYRWVDRVVWIFIVLSIALLAIELQGAQMLWLDRLITLVFALEYVLRMVSYRPPVLEVLRPGMVLTLRTHIIARLTYALRPLNLIDLLTVLAIVPALRALRALRLLRLLRGVSFFRYARPVDALVRSFNDNALTFGFAFGVVGVQVLVGGIAIYMAENVQNANVDSLGDGFWWALVTLTTVGFGDISPVTTTGRWIGAVLMIGGLFTLALFAGIVGQSMLHVFLSLQREQFRMQSNVNHVVVCGFDEGAQALLQALASEVPASREIVLFSPEAKLEDLPPRFTWVRGDPTKESELAKVRIAHASAVLVVGSRHRRPQEADAISILTVFTIRSWLARQPENLLRRVPVHIVAEILDSENVAHARAAGANEVVETHRLGFSLLSHATVAPGSATVVASMAAPDSQNLFTLPVPPSMEGQTFGDIARSVRQDHGCMVIGFQTRNNSHQLNPADDTVVPAGANLLYMAADALTLAPAPNPPPASNPRSEPV
jgi:voltage-gated potassium channel